MCLADYAACYDMVFQKADQKGKRDLAIVQDEDQNDDDVEITETYDENSAKIQLSSGCFLRKRKKRKIMRSVRYNKRKDPEDHYRELLMLYMPWRSEEGMIGQSESYEDQYNLHKDDIDKKKSEYENIGEELDIAEERLQNEEVDEECFDSIAPSVQEREVRDKAEDLPVEVGNEDLFMDYDIGPDIGLRESTEGGTAIF